MAERLHDCMYPAQPRKRKSKVSGQFRQVRLLRARSDPTPTPTLLKAHTHLHELLHLGGVWCGPRPKSITRSGRRYLKRRKGHCA